MNLFKGRNAILIVAKYKSAILYGASLREFSTRDLLKNLQELNGPKSFKLIFAEDLVYSLSVKKNSQKDRLLKKLLLTQIPEDLDKVTWHFKKNKEGDYQVFSLGTQSESILKSLREKGVNINSIHSLAWIFTQLVLEKEDNFIAIASFLDFFILLECRDSRLVFAQISSQKQLELNLKKIKGKNPRSKLLFIEESSSKLKIHLPKQFEYSKINYSISQLDDLLKQDQTVIELGSNSNISSKWFLIGIAYVILFLAVVLLVLLYFK